MTTLDAACQSGQPASISHGNLASRQTHRSYQPHGSGWSVIVTRTKFVVHFFLSYLLVLLIAPHGSATAGEPDLTEGKSREPLHQGEKAGRLELTVTAWDVLLEGLTADDATDRAAAITALGGIGRRRDVARLLQAALADKDPQVRLAAVEMVGKLRVRSAIPALRAMLQDDTPEVVFTAAQSLWRLQDDSGREVLSGVLTSQVQIVPGPFETGLGQIARKVFEPRSFLLLGLKRAGGALLGPFGFSLRVAQELTKDTSASARAVSARVLAEHKNGAARRALEQALEDNNWLVRSAAAAGLGAIGNRRAVPKLVPLLVDARKDVTYVAAASIIRLRGDRAPVSDPKKWHP